MSKRFGGISEPARSPSGSFPRQKCDSLRLLPVEQRHEAFFRCWTRKEAFIKALGEGLSHPLDQFDVSLTPDSPAVLLATRPDAQEVKRWKLWNLQVPSDYSAALAFEAESCISASWPRSLTHDCHQDEGVRPSSAGTPIAAGAVDFNFLICDCFRCVLSAFCCSSSSGLSMASMLSRVSGFDTALCNRVPKVPDHTLHSALFEELSAVNPISDQTVRPLCHEDAQIEL